MGDRNSSWGRESNESKDVSNADHRSGNADAGSGERARQLVTVTQGKGKKASVIATAQGRLENRDTKYERNMVVYTTHPDGSQSVSELRIGGTSTAIVFDK
jgi:hypothetical protein